MHVPKKKNSKGINEIRNEREKEEVKVSKMEIK
jgi:hypothetical protein